MALEHAGSCSPAQLQITAVPGQPVTIAHAAPEALHLLLARLVQVYPTQSSRDKMLLESRDESSRSQAAQQREPEIH